MPNPSQRKHAAQEMALQLMDYYGLLSQGWTFRFNRSKRNLGLCYFAPACRIELSQAYVEINPLDDIRGTILHEIAHALAGPAAYHGPRFKAIAKQIGCSDFECGATLGTHTMVPGAYQGRCPSCSKVYHMYRRPKPQSYVCNQCGEGPGNFLFFKV